MRPLPLLAAGSLVLGALGVFGVVGPLVACSSESAPGPVAATAAADAGEETPPPEGQPDAAVTDAGPKGCGVAPGGVGAVTKRHTKAAGKTRTYHLSVPASYAAGEGHALVFVLHGATDTTPENMKDWFPVEADMPNALFVYPLALERTRSDGTGGLVTRWDLDGDEDTAFFDAMVAEIADAYCVDPARIFATGFSSGGNFAHQLACLRSEVLRGFAPVAGPGPFTSPCGGAVAAWMTHDADDDALPVSNARDARDFWADQNGCGTTWAAGARAECKRNTTCPGRAPVVYCESAGVGHAIPTYAAGDIASFFKSL